MEGVSDACPSVSHLAPYTRTLLTGTTACHLASRTLTGTTLASVPSQTPESKFPVKQLTYELAPSPSRILRVDDFVLVKFLGAGGFGLVFLVFDKVTRRYFALKVIEKKRMYFTFFPKMFEEQRLGRMLVGSKWAARIEGSFDDSDNFYILMVRRNSLLNI